MTTKKGLDLLKDPTLKEQYPFLITAVTESTFTVGEVVGNVGVQIDDEDLSATSVWSSQKVQERIGSPVDFVKIFESELDSSEK